ncbi:MerR family transcriptional regulator [Streptomyces liangshanensis]|uniref:MerR family transcriptional regulator n=1 Tax=Streptomyces liangshanensis TaxID=2717324 RepID=A0A6G9H3J0_9ACTN|nr:MerR family transcriptional regulator [Streptomyces liangshanensis]QIQ05040.1 MerR family transcriptional regulator [Streptomyces liangshanensis]
MRIGEIAALVGVTPRAVRHYHHRGLLPEPVRRANGYREYSVRDAVLLARIRRLTELGLGLDEVRDVLADDAGRELAEVLAELDADLAREERAIQERRARLAELMAGPLSGGAGPVSPALARLLGTLPATDSPMAAKDRELLTLFDTADGDRRVYEALHPLTHDTEVLALYRRLDDLAEAPRDDPRIPALAAAISAAVPDTLVDAMPVEGDPMDAGFGAALLADFAPAQAEVVRRIMEALTERGRTRAREEGVAGGDGEQGVGRGSS